MLSCSLKLYYCGPHQVAERLARWKEWEVERAAYAADPEKASVEFPRYDYQFQRPTVDSVAALGSDVRPSSPLTMRRVE